MDVLTGVVEILAPKNLVKRLYNCHPISLQLPTDQELPLCQKVHTSRHRQWPDVARLLISCMTITMLNSSTSLSLLHTL